MSSSFAAAAAAAGYSSDKVSLFNVLSEQSADLAPSLRLAEVDVKGRHRLKIEDSTDELGSINAFRVAPTPSISGLAAQVPLALVAPGLDSADPCFLPRRLEPVWVSRGEERAPPTTAADKAVADVFVSVLDKVIGSVPSFKFFIQPDSGQVRTMADFRTAFYEVAIRTAWALGSQLLTSSLHAQAASEEIPMDFQEHSTQVEEGEHFFQTVEDLESATSTEDGQSLTPDVMALVGNGGRSPLLILPSRFRAVFESLVNETLRSMDTAAMSQLRANNPIMAAALAKTKLSRSRRETDTKRTGKTASAAAAQSDFRSDIFKSLDQVLLGLQEKQLQLGTAAFNATSLVGSQLKLPPMDVESFGVTEQPRVHAGFREAYLSIRSRLLELMQSATEGKLEEGGWEIMTTGHSMGGSLATLLTHDLSTKYPKNKVLMYSFGQPRTGNTAFANEYAKANGDSFRIVNEWDVIARFPRSLNASIFNYDHAGRTVLLNAPNASFWVSKA